VGLEDLEGQTQKGNTRTKLVEQPPKHKKKKPKKSLGKKTKLPFKKKSSGVPADSTKGGGGSELNLGGKKLGKTWNRLKGRRHGRREKKKDNGKKHTKN